MYNKDMTEAADLDFDESVERRQPLRFEGENGLIVNELQIDDAEELFRFFNENRDFFSGRMPQLKKIQTLHDVLLMVRNPKFSTFGIRLPESDELAGLVTVEQEADDRVSIGYGVAEKYRRQGLTSNAVKTLSYAYLQIPAINTVRAYVALDNIPSRRLLERCGFHYQGERPHVNVFYDLDKEDYLASLQTSGQE